MYYSIAIDGPAGAGKSTIAKKIAQQLDFIYVDTGAMYRAVALYMLQENINTENEKDLVSACDCIDISITYENKEQQVILNNENVTTFIRSEEVGNMASFVAKNKEIRLKLVNLQQKMAEESSVIMDGRDIGTYVLPNADLKIYLTATVKERANRRYRELTNKGILCNLEEIEADIITRDQQDMNRTFAPLKKAEDAIEIDCSEMSIEGVVDCIIDLYSNLT